jgi:hypothetical protein
MVRLIASRNHRQFLKLLLIISVCCFLPACPKGATRQTDGTPDNKTLTSEEHKYKELERDCQRLQQTLREREAANNEMRDKIARLNLLLLDKNAQIEQLEERRLSQRSMLDEAVLEVVRAKAKLRTLESRAEAASNIAEAEIALKTLRGQMASLGEKNSEILKAEDLLKMSVQEFQKENYGGALYLASQAKNHLKISKMRIRNQEEIAPVPDEMPFAQPLPLKVLKTSNLRAGPDRNAEVLTTLKKDTLVVGYSYIGQWVRVESDDGISGWIFQSLVGGR